MNAKLTCLDYAASPAEIQLDLFPFVIGRGADAQICLDDRWVSRRHCQIEEEEGTLVVRDLDSKYGTFINGKQISHATLYPGDMLSVGLSNFVAGYELSSADSREYARPELASAVAGAPYQLAGSV